MWPKCRTHPLSCWTSYSWPQPTNPACPKPSAEPSYLQKTNTPTLLAVICKLKGGGGGEGGVSIPSLAIICQLLWRAKAVTVELFAVFSPPNPPVFLKPFAFCIFSSPFVVEMETLPFYQNFPGLYSIALPMDLLRKRGCHPFQWH